MPLNSFKNILKGYEQFREKYAKGDNALMKQLSEQGQQPEICLVACCDSRVDPALLLQCNPGDLFTIRNVANVVPPYENDEAHHGTSAAMEFAVRHLNVKHLIILGHSQCGGIHALLNKETLEKDDFISHWTSLIDIKQSGDVDACAKLSLLKSYKNALSFPWIEERVLDKTLQIHLWFFDIKEGVIYAQQGEGAEMTPLDTV